MPCCCSGRGCHQQWTAGKEILEEREDQQKRIADNKMKREAMKGHSGNRVDPQEIHHEAAGASGVHGVHVKDGMGL